VYSTLLGGGSGFDVGRSIAVDAAGNAYITGDTGGDIPTTPGTFQPTSPGSFSAFVTELNPAGPERSVALGVRRK
jgi:hypothetical protein